MKKIKWLSVLMVMLLAGCISSKITSTWKAPDVVPRSYIKILVLALIHEADRTIHQDMENHFVDDLKALGYKAISAYNEYGPKAFTKMEETEALMKIKSKSVDAVITIVLLDRKRETSYIPGRISYSPYAYNYNRFWGYRSALYFRIYQPGYYVTNTKYFWESNLYDMSTQKLVYSVQTQSFDPADSEILAHEYGRLIVKQMVKENILPDHSVKAKNGVAIK
jgi:hypothetical protein